MPGRGIVHESCLLWVHGSQFWKRRFRTFFGSVANEFGPGIVTSATAGSLLMFLHNVSADPTQSFAVKIHNVKFICLDPAALCNLMADPIGFLQFTDNEVINSALTFVQTNNSGFEISRNCFSYTFAPATFSAIKIPGQVFNKDRSLSSPVTLLYRE